MRVQILKGLYCGTNQVLGVQEKPKPRFCDIPLLRLL